MYKSKNICLQEVWLLKFRSQCLEPSWTNVLVESWSFLGQIIDDLGQVFISSWFLLCGRCHDVLKLINS